MTKSELEAEAVGYTTIKEIAKIIKETENEVNTIYDDSTLENPIVADLVLSKRNMGYNNIKAVVKKYIKKMKGK